MEFLDISFSLSLCNRKTLNMISDNSQFMPKKCIICDDEAKFSIKGTRDYYCKECAVENFGDLSMLIRVEEVAARLKEILDGKMKAPQEEEMEAEMNKE